MKVNFKVAAIETDIQAVNDSFIKLNPATMYQLTSQESPYMKEDIISFQMQVPDTNS